TGALVRPGSTQMLGWPPRMRTPKRLMGGSAAMVATLALAGCHSQRGLRGTDAGSSPDTVFEEAGPDRSEGAAGRADPGLDAGGTGGVAGSGDAADALADRKSV